MIDGVLAGLAVGLGSVAYMIAYDGTIVSHIVAALCFSIIMMSIPYYRLDFFLGRPGVLTSKNIDPIENMIIYMGNFIGITWIALLMKLIPQYGEKIGIRAHEVLMHLHEYSWDTVFILSIFAGMMFYAGAMATVHGNSIFYFLLVNFVCIFAEWPTVHLIFWCLWSDSWDIGWYLIIPTTLGNIIGANLWVLLRKHSPTYQNAEYLKPDSYDIADKFHEFV